MTKKHFISDDDKALFREAMDEIPDTAHTPSNFDDEMDNGHYGHFYPTDLSLVPNRQWAGPDMIMHYSAPNLNLKQYKALKGGQLKTDCRIDCHGMKQKDACEMLNQAFNEARTHGDRHLLIIHGKGFQSGQKRAGQLKNLLNQTLPSHPDVLAFHTAQARHGGTGALYVLLKTHKP